MDRETIETGFELCANGEPCTGEKFTSCPFSPRNNAEQNCGVTMARNALALLKEDCHNCKLECLLQKYDELKEKYDALLKEQEAVTIKKTKEHGFGVYGGICPKCRNWIQSAHSFCGFCGQEVKWYA